MELEFFDPKKKPKISDIDKELKELIVDETRGALDDKSEPLNIMDVIEDMTITEQKKYIDFYQKNCTKSWNVDESKIPDENKTATKIAMGKAAMEGREMYLLTDTGEKVLFTPESIDTPERNNFKDGDDFFNYDIIDKDGNKKQVTADEAKSTIEKSENLEKTAEAVGKSVIKGTKSAAKSIKATVIDKALAAGERASM